MFKKLLITMGVLFVVVVIGARIIPSFISEDRIKEVVAAKTRELLGYDIAINGELNFRVFPMAGVYMEGVSITQPQKPDLPAIATFKSVKVDVETLALINGDIIIKGMVLDSPNIKLSVDKSGAQNWAASKPKKTKIYNSSNPNTEAPAPHKDMGKLSLQNVRVENGVVSYTDEKSKEQWSAENIHINISLDDMNAPFEVNGRMEYNKQQLTFDTSFNTLDSFINKKQADIEARIKNKLLSIEAEGKIDGGSYTGSTSLVSPSLPKAAEWLTQKPLETRFSSALPLNIKSKTNCSPDMCHFAKSTLKLDSMGMSGDVKVFFGKKLPTVELIVDTNELDFNLFMHEEEETAFSLISSAHAAEGWSATPMDFSVLRKIDLVARVNAAGIKVRNINIGRTVFRAKIERGKLSTDIIDADFYGGKATIIASVDATPKIPHIKKSVDLRGVQMESFLKDAEVTDRFIGKTDFKMNMAATGHSEQEIIATMKGAGSIKTKDGSVKGVNIAQMLRNVQAAFKDGVDTSRQSTDFSELGGTFTIKDGIVSNNDMRVKAPLFRAKGSGLISLPQKNLKYRITPEIVQTAQGQGGKKKSGIGVPILISGSFDKLQYRPDAAATIKQIAKDPKKLKETVKGLKGQLKENKGAIKGLLKSFKKKKDPQPQE